MEMLNLKGIIFGKISEDFGESLLKDMVDYFIFELKNGKIILDRTQSLIK